MKIRNRHSLKKTLVYKYVGGLLASAAIIAIGFSAFFGILGDTETSEANPWSDYTYGKYIEIQASKVAGSGSLSDFPVLLSFTDSNLRTIANGGELENANGYDITFTRGDCNSTLDFEIEDYDPVTGNLLVWVKVPSVSATSNTGIHMYYSRTGVSSDPSTSAVWSSYDAAVFHLDGDNLDASGNGNSGTNYGASTANGIIDDGFNYDGTNDYASTASNELATANEFSVSVWFKADATNFAHHIWWQGENNGNGWGNTHQEMHLTLGDWTTTYNPDVIHFFMGDIGIDITQDVIHIRSAFTDTSSWHNAVVNVKDLNTNPFAELYLDGTFLGADSGTTAKTSRSNWTNNFKIASPYSSSRRFDGKVDELRIATSAKSPEWIETVYNMVTDPAGFITKSGQMTGDDLCRLLPIELTDFRLEQIDASVNIIWETASEINTDYFIIERSVDGNLWTEIAHVKAAGNSSHSLSYSVIDDAPTSGINYYRLKELDLDGEVILFDPEAIVFESKIKSPRFYPNPVTDFLHVSLAGNNYDQVDIFSLNGKILKSERIDGRNTGVAIRYDLSNYPDGMYYVRLSGKAKAYTGKIVKQ